MGTLNPSRKERWHAVLSLWILFAIGIVAVSLVDVRTGLIDVWSFDNLWQMTAVFSINCAATIAVYRRRM